MFYIIISNFQRKLCTSTEEVVPYTKKLFSFDESKRLKFPSLEDSERKEMVSMLLSPIKKYFEVCVFFNVFVILFYKNLKIKKLTINVKENIYIKQEL